MLKTFQKEQISCRGRFFEEIKAIGVEKMFAEINAVL